MRLYKLPETVLTIKGDTSGFLKGIASNALDAPLNAFLNLHGRIIATFRQKQISDDEFLNSVPSIAVDNLLKHLERYAKLSRVSLSYSTHSVYVNLESAEIIWSVESYPNSISEEGFTLFRLNRHIPLMGIDYQADEFILNVHEYDYVSYTKGCFLGQEPVAKVHNRAKPSRKLIVEYEDRCTPEDTARMTSKMLDPQRGIHKGFLFVSNKQV